MEALLQQLLEFYIIWFMDGRKLCLVVRKLISQCPRQVDHSIHQNTLEVFFFFFLKQEQV